MIRYTSRYLIFTAFFLLCLRLILAILLQADAITNAFLGTGLLLIAFAAYWNSFWTLFCFAATVPLLSGIQAIGLLGGFPLSGAAFAAVYAGWFLKISAGRDKRMEHNGIASDLADILSAMVLLSLISVVIRYPFDFVLYRFFYYPFGQQAEALYGIEAAQTVLQGLFFFRLCIMEFEKRDTSAFIKPLFYIHTGIIIIFATIQVIFGIPELHWNTFGVKSPFGNIHSFGAYASILLFFFLTLLFNSLTMGKIFWGFISLYLLALIFMSGGNITLLAILAAGLVLLAIKKRKYFVVGAVTLGIAITLLLASPSIFNDTSSFVMKRYSKFFDMENPYTRYGSIEARLALWDRALAMIRDYPATGSGIGTYYAESIRYHDTNVKEWERYKSFHENTHNYYLQFAAELGLPALAIFLMIIGNCYVSMTYRFRRLGDAPGALVGLALGLGVFLITMITGHHLLVDAQQFLFWIVISVILHNSGRGLAKTH